MIDPKWIGELYQGFVLGTEYVEDLFWSKFRRHPARVIVTGGAVLAGPITEAEMKATQRKEIRRE